MTKEKSRNPVRVLLIDGDSKHCTAATAYAKTDPRIDLYPLRRWAEGGGDSVEVEGLEAELWGAAIVSTPSPSVYESADKIINNLRRTKTPYIVFDGRNPDATVTYTLNSLIESARTAPCNAGFISAAHLPVSTESVPFMLSVSGPKTSPESWKSCIDALFGFYARTSYNDKVNPAWLLEYAAGRDRLRTLRDTLRDQYRRAGGEPKTN